MPGRGFEVMFVEPAYAAIDLKMSGAHTHTYTHALATADALHMLDIVSELEDL